ncbi:MULTISPECIES: helix-turn-helix transcriptional regulator [unclassified Pseudoalteromonas]|uniref:helix-turn-helix transcriptional regulator n=1 Tax=unclassified Pseudoalteromonas TaxID=194690 RepID=UPI001F442E2C|nr:MULTISPECIES: AlpA family transcriptional regulator [unclassified Pseudoalteromonas]MCF2826891.1 AlpA family transcriptional regulator [Pseudoalteromonas sp. OF5H-5]MCF2830588.1 AlpA family transcriptional regulator [Pseudoalteromonas sp. DL2-H6]MCF2923980.1 AlpA family transcriptional regulator [Pseudoalteromonas sp. DL2-H1]
MSSLVPTPNYRTNVRGDVVTINDKFLRANQVADKCGISRSTVYTLMNKSQFPPSHKITSDRVVWLEADIEEWMRLGAEQFYLTYGQNTTQQAS